MKTLSKSSPMFIEKIDIIPSAAILALIVTWLLHQANAAGSSLPSFPSWALIAAFIAFALAITYTQRLSKKGKQKSLSFITHFGAWLLISALFWQLYFWDYLNGRWAQESTLFTGKMSIILLFLSLAVTPFMTLFNWRELNPLKKPLGNYAFILVCTHLLIFTYDYGYLDGSLLVGLAFNEAVTKQYALVGLIAFILLIPLAATSNKWSIKRLKKNWKKLHQLVYLIGMLAAAHYIWVWTAKRAFTEPFIYAVILFILLLIRVKPIKQRIIHARQRLAKWRRTITA